MKKIFTGIRLHYDTVYYYIILLRICQELFSKLLKNTVFLLSKIRCLCIFTILIVCIEENKMVR